MLLIIYLNKGCSIRKNDPLKDIDITKILMHLDWPNMARYDAQNKEVNLEKNKDRVVFMGNSITEGWSHYMP